jgi:hypothetical protein
MNRWVFAGLAVVLLTAAAFSWGCRRTAPPALGPEASSGPEWFEDITERVGLHFVHDAGPGDYFMPRQVGSGAALFDFNKDGRLDIYLLQNGGSNSKSPNRLYRQTDDGHFADVSAGSGLDIAGFNMGAAIGDVNNDGWPDVLVTQYGGVKLFLNKGDGTFLDVTERAGLSNPSWGTSAAFFDYDRDGWLDLIVVNYLDYDPSRKCEDPYGKAEFCAPKMFRGRVSRLFHNRGTGGPRAGSVSDGPPVANTSGSWKGFVDVTEGSRLGQRPGPGLGVVCADFNADGWPDIFIANDGAPNHLWINQKDGTFKEEAALHGLAYNGMGQAQAGMGIALGDVDGDGLFDIFVTHLTDENNTLWRQGPAGLFRDRSAAAGLMEPSARGTGFGTVLADFDDDGVLDLAIVNGRVEAHAHVTDWSLGPFWSRYAERNQIFRGDGQGRFENVSRQNSSLCGRPNVARGLVRGDIDGDGAVDLLLTTIAGPARLYRNIAPKRGHWMHVFAFDPRLKRDAFGSVIRLRAGGRTRVGWLHPAESFLASSEPCVHFGLGDAAHVDAIEIVWPDGSVETFDGPHHDGYAADQRLQLRKGQGTRVISEPRP